MYIHFIIFSYELTARTPQDAEEWVRSMGEAIKQLEKTPYSLYLKDHNWKMFVTASFGGGGWFFSFLSEKFKPFLVVYSTKLVCSATQTAEQVKQQLILKLKSEFKDIDATV